MSTKIDGWYVGSAIKSIRAGERVVYSTGEKSFDAVALAEPPFGLVAGSSEHSIHLKLVYLDDQGKATTLKAAPLHADGMKETIMEALCDQDVRKSRGAEKRTIVQHRKAVGEQTKRRTAQPCTAGWRPYRPLETAFATSAKVFNL